MRVGAILGRWIEVLAALLFRCQEAWRGRRSLILSHDAAGLLIGRARTRGIAAPSNSSVPVPLTDQVVQAARNGLVVLELPPEKVVARQISLPAKAREFLPGIIRNQIDRLSPWPADEAVYGFAASARREDAAALDVHVLITSRAIIEAARAEIAAIGLVVDRIIVHAGAAVTPVALWSRLAEAPHSRGRRLIGMAIAGCVGLSFALTLWALISAIAIRDASADLAARTETLERQLHTALSAVSTGPLTRYEGAWIAKQTEPSTVALLEALSRTLPDDAYLTDLRFERATVRIIGLAADAPSLIAPLEQSGHFSNVHFFAPTTRGSEAALYRFHIEAQVEPRLSVNAEPSNAETRP
jgi:general secretion pathway protein L